MKAFKSNLIIGLCLLFAATPSFTQIQEAQLQADDDTGLQLEFLSNDTNQTNQIGTLNDGDLTFRADGPAGFETLRILDDNGFMGIGKIDPISRVDVLGSLTLSLDNFPVGKTTLQSRSNLSAVGGGGGVSLQFNGIDGVLSGITYDGLDTRFFNNETNIGGGWIVLRANGGASADVLIQAQNDIRFGTGPLFTQNMTITETGNVGIGTTTPSVELEVAGGIKVGNTTVEEEGTIRFDGTNLQAYIGGAWQNILPIADCTNSFVVTSPPANQTFSQDFSINGSSQIVINVTFNNPVNPATVVSGSTFILQSGGTTIPGTITWNGSNTMATFVTTAAYTSFCSFTPDCFMNLQIIGTDAGSGAVEDANGCTLDGDGNGTQGGNYTTTFGILG